MTSACRWLRPPTSTRPLFHRQTLRAWRRAGDAFPGAAADVDAGGAGGGGGEEDVGGGIYIVLRLK
jgi:hypothetical protein